MYELDGEQKARLVEIIRDESGDNLSRAEFTDAMLLLFENIAGFETLPLRICQRYLTVLWQSYESACRVPTRSKKNQQ